MKCHMKFTSSQLLTKIIKVLEGKQCKRYAVQMAIALTFKYSKHIFALNQSV